PTIGVSSHIEGTGKDKFGKTRALLKLFDDLRSNSPSSEEDLGSTVPYTQVPIMHSAKKLERTEAVLSAVVDSVPAESARDLANRQLTSYKQHNADEYMQRVDSVKSTAQPPNGNSSTNVVRKFFIVDNMVTATQMSKSKCQPKSRPIRRGLPKNQRKTKSTTVKKVELSVFQLLQCSNRNAQKKSRRNTRRSKRRRKTSSL
uniref:Uncharacterized protein n=1 Tax=Parascaris univalens TaxID=6257 RepID=A0A914ZZ64_PARUN